MAWGTAAGAVPDVLSGVAGIFQNMVLVSVFKREVTKLRGRIDAGMARNKGVLLVMRTETAGFEGSIKRVLGVYYAAAGMHPVGLISQWRRQPHIWPAPTQGLLGAATVEESYLWVCRSKDMSSIYRGPVMTAGQATDDYKLVPYEQLY